MTKSAAESPLVLFGAQSGRPREADVIRTLEGARRAGFSDYCVYARNGLELEYMGEEWLDLVALYLKHAERLGMHIWLYDEFAFPSGSCHGRVGRECDDWRNQTCAVYARPGGTFEWKRFPAKPESANVFDMAAMKRFRELTHEVYEKRFLRYFGNVIRGIFSDEPGSAFGTTPDPGAIVTFRWYRGLEEDYKSETGRDFKTDVESYCRDTSRLDVWDSYIAVMGHAFRHAFADPISAWCKRLGIVSTGHLMAESDPLVAQLCNGLTLHALKGMTKPGVDEISTRTESYSAEWLTFASAEHAISRGKDGGVAELFALGPCDLAFDRMLQMIWLTALHRIDTWFLALHYLNAAGFVEKPHYAMFFTPDQPYFHGMEPFHEAARTASDFAKKPFAHDVAVIYPERRCGTLSIIGGEAIPPIVDLIRELTSVRQLSVNLVEEGGKTDEKVAFDFAGARIIDRMSGRTFDTVEGAAELACSVVRNDVRVQERAGRSARDVILRRYFDGTAAVLNLTDDDRLLELVVGETRIPFALYGRGHWLYRPATDGWDVSTDRPLRRRVRFLADGTARIQLDAPRAVRFATCFLRDATARLTLDGKPLEGVRPCSFLGYGYNPCYLETERMELAAGEHVFTAEGREDRGLFLPLLWMEDESSSDISNFSGIITFGATVNVPRDAESLVLGTRRMHASVRLGEHDLGIRIAAPWQWTVPPELRGETARLEVRIATSVRPMFGADADDVPGAFPSNRPKWVRTLPKEPPPGLDYAYWA